MPTTNLSIRFTDRELQTLDKLVLATKVYYEGKAQAFPPATHLAAAATRSSAIRDLLLAWERGEADKLFSRDITEATK